MASRLFAPHYAAPVERISSEAAPLYSKATEQSEPVGELTKGDVFALLDITGDWAWGYRKGDHLVGYVRASALGENETAL